MNLHKGQSGMIIRYENGHHVKPFGREEGKKDEGDNHNAFGLEFMRQDSGPSLSTPFGSEIQRHQNGATVARGRKHFGDKRDFLYTSDGEA